MHWFKISDLDVDGEPVHYLSGEGVVLGYLKIGRKGQRDHRFRLPTGHVRSVPEDFLLGWRPKSPETWPCELPEPMARSIPRQFPKPTVSKPSDLPGEAQNAFGEGLRLGPAGMPPVSRDEAAARILRAIRTDDYMATLEDRDMARMGFQGCTWPPEYMHATYVIASNLRTSRSGTCENFRPEDYDDYHVDRAYLATTYEKWRPLPRDISDWEARVLLWGRGLNALHWRILRWRASNPPYTFKQIGDREHKSSEWARQKYGEAIDRVWEAAR